MHLSAAKMKVIREDTEVKVGMTQCVEEPAGK